MFPHVLENVILVCNLEKLSHYALPNLFKVPQESWLLLQQINNFKKMFHTPKLMFRLMFLTFFKDRKYLLHIVAL